MPTKNATKATKDNSLPTNWQVRYMPKKKNLAGVQCTYVNNGTLSTCRGKHRLVDFESMYCVGHTLSW